MMKVYSVLCIELYEVVEQRDMDGLRGILSNPAVGLTDLILTNIREQTADVARE